jgi:Family of unknown function (DUF6092)
VSSDAKPDPDLFPLMTFLSTAARGGLEEGVFTATYRLVDTIRRLLELFPRYLEDPFFHELHEVLETNLNKAYLMSEEEYTAFLDDLLRRFAAEVRKRNGLG